MIRLLAMAARWIAIAIAIAAVLDPELRVPRRERAVVRVTGEPEVVVSRVASALTDAGFVIDPAAAGAVSVVVSDRLASVPVSEAPTWVADTTPAGPNVRVAQATAGAARLPNQAVEIRVTVDAIGVKGKSTDVVVEDGGVPVASTRHAWTTDEEQWTTALQYLPPSITPGRLHVRAVPLVDETSMADNAGDVGMPPLRGPVRVLVIESAVTWPALFVRRALEGEPAFRIASVQRAAKSVATRAGAPPGALSRETLTPFDVTIVGGPEHLSVPDVAALQWFVEDRGGILVLVPDQRPSGNYTSLVGAGVFDERVLDTPVRLGPDLMAAELVVLRTRQPAATTLAADPEGHAVVFSTRRGEGTVIFSGALDAWRQRGQDNDSFARFWRRAIANAALTVPPALDVSVVPSAARPGDPVVVTARVRANELAPANRIEITALGARAVNPSAKRDDPVRLWPTAEPGVFSGEWRPSAAGTFNISVSSGPLHGDAFASVDPAVVHPSPRASLDLARLARASGGQAFPIDRLDAMVTAIQTAYPPRSIGRAAHPMRSPWWCLPFALLLCGEWALRRTRGLP